MTASNEQRLYLTGFLFGHLHEAGVICRPVMDPQKISYVPYIDIDLPAEPYDSEVHTVRITIVPPGTVETSFEIGIPDEP